MLTLILVYCLASSPSACIERRREPDPSAGSATAMGCMMAGELAAADPEARAEMALEGYSFSGWRCEVNVKHREKA